MANRKVIQWPFLEGRYLLLLIYGLSFFITAEVLAFFHRIELATSAWNILGLVVVGISLGTLFALGKRKGIAPSSIVTPLVKEAGISFAIVSLSYVSIALTGSLDSPLYPVLYAAIAFLAAFIGTRAGAIGVSVAISYEVLGPALAVQFQAGATWIFHIGFIIGFAVVHRLFWQGVVANLRNDRKQAVRGEVARMQEAARDFRLSAGRRSNQGRDGNQDYLTLQAGSAELVKDSATSSLLLLAELLDCDRAHLLWRHFGCADATVRAGIGPKVELGAKVPIAGAITPVFRDGKTVQLDAARPRQLPFTKFRESSAFLGVPIKVEDTVCGAMVVEREKPFHAGDLERLENSAKQIGAMVHSERAFFATEKAKFEHERFYHASAMLCRALTLEDVLSTAFKAAGLICDFDFGAITQYEPKRRYHSVLRSYFANDAAPLCSAAGLKELTFKDNDGLVSMAIKNRRYLPHSGGFHRNTIPVFNGATPVRGAESLIVMPFLAGGAAFGSIVLASRKPQAFGEDVREMLSVITQQVATSMQNALLYRKMETMATTDGLTGLTNHRSFKERSKDLLERSARHEHMASILLCDVDHFKLVNDTHGHPVGDEVLRRVARVLESAVRRIDITARYGGEEFAIVLESTGHEGAINLADRIREDVAKLRIPCENGTFSITMSIGVASFPDHGISLNELIEQADMALYRAKEGGRNCVVSAGSTGVQRVAS